MAVDIRSYNLARMQGRRSLQSAPHRAHSLLRSGIRTGGLREAAALSEDALIASLSTSRNSVRAALQQLAAEGLVDRRPNRGTKVIASISDVAVDQVVPAQAFGSGATVRQVDQRLMRATAYMRERLMIDHDEIDMAETLVTFDGEPRSLRVSYCSAADGPVQRVLDVIPVPVAFERVFGVPLGRYEASVGAVGAGHSDSRLLGIAEGAPVLVEEVVLYDVDGVARELSYTHHRADRVAVSVNHLVGPGYATVRTDAVPAEPAC